MKQAILLLAHNSFTHIKEFCNQFNNDKRFNIYIHYDTKLKLSEEQITELYNTFTNIKYICSEINCKYFNLNIVDAEIIIIKEALKNPENITLHLMSELDRLIVNLDDFYNIHISNPQNYIMLINCKQTEINKWRIIDNDKCFYFGSQWWSLTADSLRNMFNYNGYNEYYKMLQDYNKKTCKQAIDEVFFQNLVYLTNTPYINNYTRYVDWNHREENGCHPAHIDYTNYFWSEQINEIKNGNYLIVRKIDTTTDNGNKTMNIIKSMNEITTQPKVSICMCTRNRALLMLPSIKCILSQTYINFEFIIIDDCSDDNTEEIVKDLQEQDKRIKYYKLEKHNFINARNEAFKRATGDFIALIDSDDKCSPNKIASQVKFLINNPNIDVVGCKIKFGSKTSNLSIPNTLIDWDNNYFQEKIKSENISMLLHFPAIMFRKSIINKIFPNEIYFYPELINGGEDQIFLYSLYINGAKFANITDGTYLYNYLEYDDAISSSVGKHFDNSNFIFKYIHNRPYDEKIKIVNKLYNKYNTKA